MPGERRHSSRPLTPSVRDAISTLHHHHHVSPGTSQFLLQNNTKSLPHDSIISHLVCGSAGLATPPGVHSRSAPHICHPQASWAQSFRGDDRLHEDKQIHARPPPTSAQTGALKLPPSSTGWNSHMAKPSLRGNGGGETPPMVGQGSEYLLNNHLICGTPMTLSL